MIKSYIYKKLIKTFKIHLTTRGVANFDILEDFRLPHKCFRMSILYFHVEQLTFDFRKITFANLIIWLMG